MSLIFLFLTTSPRKNIYVRSLNWYLSRTISQALRMPVIFHNKNALTFMSENEGETIVYNIADGSNY